MRVRNIMPYIGALIAAVTMHNTASASVDASQIYVGAGGAGVHEFDINNANVDYDFGYGYSGKIGFLPKSEGWLSHVRLEGEFVQQANNLSRESTGGEGETTLYAGMINAYYDFPRYKGIRPYIGVGGGYAEVELEGEPSFGVVDASDDGTALQAMMGFTFSHEAMQKTHFYAGYRIFGVLSELKFDDVGGGTEEGYYLTQSVEFGFTYRF